LARAIGDRLATTLAVIESVTVVNTTDDLGARVATACRSGVDPRALVCAGYINFGFNVINRVADGLGVMLPGTPDLKTAATMLLRIGYRPLAGVRWIPTMRLAAGLDPFEPLVATLRDRAVAGPGRLDRSQRVNLYEGTAAGALGDFGRAVAERAWTITRKDTDAQRGLGAVEDSIFEATICAAVGASMRRLDRLMTILHGQLRIQSCT
jgi:hypothetical protein